MVGSNVEEGKGSVFAVPFISFVALVFELYCVPSNDAGGHSIQAWLAFSARPNATGA